MLCFQMHAEIKYDSRRGQYEIFDRGSQNGTYINDLRIAEVVYVSIFSLMQVFMSLTPKKCWSPLKSILCIPLDPQNIYNLCNVKINTHELMMNRCSSKGSNSCIIFPPHRGHSQRKK